MKSNLIFIGYRATGKSTLSKYLSEKINRKYIDTDIHIENKMNISIENIFTLFGEERFREEETLVLKSLLNIDNCIISTGGGIIERDINRKILSNLGYVIWLRSSVGTIYNRIRNQHYRPYLTDKNLYEEISYKMKFRKNLYKSISNYELYTDKLTIEECCEYIFNLL